MWNKICLILCHYYDLYILTTLNCSIGIYSIQLKLWKLMNQVTSGLRKQRYCQFVWSWWHGIIQLRNKGDYKCKLKLWQHFSSVFKVVNEMGLFGFSTLFKVCYSWIWWGGHSVCVCVFCDFLGMGVCCFVCFFPFWISLWTVQGVRIFWTLAVSKVWSSLNGPWIAVLDAN